MTMVEGRFINETLKTMMDKLYNAVVDRYDGLFYIGGGEGRGKSTLALQLAWYLDRNFTLDNVVFSGESFIDKCMNAKRGDCIVFDESYSVFNNRNYAASLSKRIYNMLTRIRSKNLFMIIVSPTFFDISKFLIVHRSMCFIRVYDNDFKRGFFAYYKNETKNQLYFKGKRDYNIHAVKPSFRGTFTKWCPVDLDDYEIKKQEGMKDDVYEDKKPSQVDMDKFKWKNTDDFLIWLRSNNLLKRGALKQISTDFYHIKDGSLTRRLMRRIEE